VEGCFFPDIVFPPPRLPPTLLLGRTPDYATNSAVQFSALRVFESRRILFSFPACTLTSGSMHHFFGTLLLPSGFFSGAPSSEHCPPLGSPHTVFCPRFLVCLTSCSRLLSLIAPLLVLRRREDMRRAPPVFFFLVIFEPSLGIRDGRFFFLPCPRIPHFSYCGLFEAF